MTEVVLERVTIEDIDLSKLTIQSFESQINYRKAGNRIGVRLIYPPHKIRLESEASENPLENRQACINRMLLHINSSVT